MGRCLDATMLEKVKHSPSATGVIRVTKNGEVRATPDSGPVVPQRRWHGEAERISVLGIGCARMGSIRNFTPVSEIKRMLEMALDHGVNVFDTADIYGQGDAERILGSVIKRRRDDAFLITKIGFSFDGGSQLVSRLKPLLRMAAKHSQGFNSKLETTRDAVISQDFSIERLTKALDGCLKRLGVDAIDGLLLHSPPTGVLQDERIAEFLRTAKQQGKIKHFGAAVETVDGIKAALEIEGLELLQADVQSTCDFAADTMIKGVRDLNIAFFVRELLRSHGESANGSVRPINQALPAALNIPNVTCAIIGLSSRKHLQAAIDAVS